MTTIDQADGRLLARAVKDRCGTSAASQIKTEVSQRWGTVCRVSLERCCTTTHAFYSVLGNTLHYQSVPRSKCKKSKGIDDGRERDIENDCFIARPSGLHLQLLPTVGQCFSMDSKDSPNRRTSCMPELKLRCTMDKQLHLQSWRSSLQYSTGRILKSPIARD